METDNKSHTVFQNDPIKLQSFVKKYVEVTKTNGKTSRGTVFTIDPVSESVLLLTKSCGKLSAELVSGHAVSAIQIVDQPADYEEPNDSLFAPKTDVLPSKAVQTNKQMLKTWLNENRLPIKECGDLLTMDNVLTIHPPYNAENVVSHNEIVLERVQNLIKNMISK